MIYVYSTARAAVVKKREKITSGTVGLTATFAFDSAWYGLYPVFNFNGSGQSVDSAPNSVVTEENNEVTVTIPHECLTQYGGSLTVGIYGARENNGVTTLAIPTIYCAIGQIERGATVSGATEAAATASAVQQIVSAVSTMNQWDNISGKPATYPPSEHNHDGRYLQSYTETDPTVPSWAKQTSKPTYTASEVGALAVGYHDDTKQDKLVAGNGITIAADGKTISAQGGGGSSAWADITGKPSTFPPSSHTHQQADVAGLVSNLSSKANAIHTHAQSEVTGLANTLAGKQDSIADLSTIRSGAAAGATALQSVPNTYRTAEQQDAIHDSTKAENSEFQLVKADVDDIKRVIDALYEEAVDGV